MAIRKSGDRDLTAKEFITRLKELQSAEELKKIQRYFKSGKGEYGLTLLLLRFFFISGTNSHRERRIFSKGRIRFRFQAHHKLAPSFAHDNFAVLASLTKSRMYIDILH